MDICMYKKKKVPAKPLKPLLLLLPLLDLNQRPSD
jgi:hypothetical protein